jgi:hypothetical protein
MAITTNSSINVKPETFRPHLAGMKSAARRLTPDFVT